MYWGLGLENPQLVLFVLIVTPWVCPLSKTESLSDVNRKVVLRKISKTGNKNMLLIISII